VAELLDTTVASVNSALQRARATLAAVEDGGAMTLDAAEQELLDRYVDAFERYDIDALVSLLHEEARFSMPPFPLWFKRREDVAWWMLGPGGECRGSIVRVVEANGQPAMAQWRCSPGGGFHAWAIQVMEMHGGVITNVIAFVEPELFPLFGLPLHLDEAGAPI
jgi:RNA polymerase sigma-70 factor (ECF subfamily)